MSNPESLKFRFRLLVFISMALYVGTVFLPYIEFAIYGEDIVEPMSWAGYGAFWDGAALTILWLGSIFAYGVVSIGLIYFKSWSRECFLLLTVILLLSNFAYGIGVYTELSSFFGQILNLLDGLIIGMIYFSKLRDEFGSIPGKPMSSDATNPRR